MPMKNLAKNNADRRNRIHHVFNEDEIVETREVSPSNVVNEEDDNEELERIPQSLVVEPEDEIDPDEEDEDEDDDVTDPDTDTSDLFSGFRRPPKPSGNRIIDSAGVLSVVNSKKNGKRVVISADVMKNIGDPDTVQIALSNREMAIAMVLPGEIGETFIIKKTGKKGVVYAYKLVEDITNTFALDFSNRTSLTFHNAKYVTPKDSDPIAIITMA